MNNTKYPIYIISKGRAESRQTSKALEEMNLNYHIVIEPQEFKEYNKYINENKIKVLPFSNLGQGSIPVRNWVWEDSIKRGFKKHWILDDNISGFVRLNKGKRIQVKTSIIFNCIEDFVDRYTNIKIAGMNYRFFAGSWIKKPYFLNTRIYSIILIDNSIKHRWRGKYNEDTDLSLRVLKDGFCTVLFNTFLGNKAATLTMSGGNTDEVYIDGDNRLKFAQSLQSQHPNYVKITQKWGRYHHQVDYRPFKVNKLIFRDDYIKKQGINNYGMILKCLENTENGNK